MITKKKINKFENESRMGQGHCNKALIRGLDLDKLRGMIKEVQEARRKNKLSRKRGHDKRCEMLIMDSNGFKTYRLQSEAASP